MATKPFDEVEQRFIADTGLEPADLEWIAVGAPPAPGTSVDRIRRMTRRKLGLPVESGAGDVTGATDASRAAAALRRAAPVKATRGWRQRWLATAVAALIVMGSSLAVLQVPTARAALERLFRLVPGIGISEVQPQSLVLAEPVVVQGPHGNLVVTAVLSTDRHTELHFTVKGLTTDQVKPELVTQAPDPATLLFADGRRWEQAGAQIGAGTGEVRGILHFQALPDDVRDVTLELPALHGLTDPFTATLRLTPGGDKQLLPAVVGSRSAPKHSVTVEAPHVVQGPDRITVSLAVDTEWPGARINRIGGYDGNPHLTDNLGNAYPLVPTDSQLFYSTARALSATFGGPVSGDAGSLRLTVDAVQVVEAGEGRLRVPLERLPIGERTAWKQDVQIGRWPVVVRSIERVADDRFALDLDLGADRDAAILQYLRIQPTQSVGGSNFRLDPATRQARAFEVTYRPTGPFLDLTFSEPTVEVSGPWQVDLPVR